MPLRGIGRGLPAALLVLSALPLASQTGETQPAKVEVFTGYSWMNSNSTISGTKTIGGVAVPVTERLKDAKSGFVVSGSYFFNKWFGLTLDTGAHFGNNYDYDEVLIGPTIRFPAEHTQPFIHALGGWTRLSPGIQNS